MKLSFSKNAFTIFIIALSCSAFAKPGDKLVVCTREFQNSTGVYLLNLSAKTAVNGDRDKGSVKSEWGTQYTSLLLDHSDAKWDLYLGDNIDGDLLAVSLPIGFQNQKTDFVGLVDYYTGGDESDNASFIDENSIGKGTEYRCHNSIAKK